jgi:nucleoid-associated protein YgaU
MREAPSTYSERAIHKIRLEMRGLPLIKAKSKPKAPKIPASEAESEASSASEAEAEAKPEVKAEVKAKAEAKPEVKPKAEAKAEPVAKGKPEVKAEDPHAEARRAFVAEGNEEVVIEGKVYYRMSTGECFTPGETPYTIAEYMGVWDADLGEFVINEY